MSMYVLSDIDSQMQDSLGLGSLGFQAEFFPANHCTRLSRMRGEDKKDNIVYNYAVVHDDLYLSNVLFTGVSLLAVEQILQDVIAMDPQFGGYRDEFHSETVINIPGVDKGSAALEAVTAVKFVERGTFYPERLVKAATLFREYFEQYIFPFFELVDSAETVNERVIKKVPQMELSNYIAGLNMTSRKQIIMWMVGDPGYDDYVSWLGEALEKSIEMDASYYGLRYAFHKALTNYLRTKKN